MSAQKPAVVAEKESRLEPAERLVSLDALRGFDMFWIVGAEGLVHGLKKLGENPAIKIISDQLEHKKWDGLAFEDLIFPLFVFLSGVSMVFSLSKSLAQHGRFETIKKLFWRGLLLFLIGIFYSGGFANPFEKVRWMGVLQRIALSYFFAGLIFCCFDLRGRIAALITLLVGYWALMTFVPVPGIGAGNFAEKMNLANYIDKIYLPGKRYDGDHDPEGLLSTLPAIGSCLLGVLAGMLLKSSRDPKQKVSILAIAGIALIALGYAWSFQFPIIKKIWTSSFVLAAGGYGALMLALFYCIIDVWKFQKWAAPFIWIGTNALAIYLAHSLLNFNGLAKRFVGGDIAIWLGNWALLVQALAALALTLLFARFLYQRKVFIRI